MHNNRRNLKSGVIMSYLWVLIHIFVNFIYAPLMIRYLGKSEYGLYQLVASFLAYINVLETSLSSGVLRFYCNSLAKGNERSTENTLAICRSIYRKLSLVVLLIGALLIVVFRKFYQSSLSAAEIYEGSLMLGLLVFNLVITMNNALYLACMRGNEYFTIDKGISCVSQLLQLLLCFLLISRFRYAIVVTIITVLMNTAVSFLRYSYVKRELGIKVVLHERDRALARNILLFSSGILLSGIADQIFWRTDQIILAKLYNTSVVAVYAIGAQIYTNYMYAGTTVAGVFFPRVSTYYQQEQGMKKISDLFIRVGRIAFMLCFMVFSGFVIFGKEFLYLWVGKDYLTAYWMAIVVMIPFTVDIVQHLGLTILQVIDKFSFRAKIYFLAALLNVVLTIFLAKYMAGFGAALSTAISIFITSGLIMNIYYAKHVKLDIKSFWNNIVGMLFKLILPTGIFFFLNYIADFEYSVISFIVKLCLFAFTYSAYSYFFVMNEDEKYIIKKLFAKVVMKAKL